MRTRLRANSWIRVPIPPWGPGGYSPQVKTMFRGRPPSSSRRPLAQDDLVLAARGRLLVTRWGNQAVDRALADAERVRRLADALSLEDQPHEVVAEHVRHVEPELHPVGE